MKKLLIQLFKIIYRKIFHEPLIWLGYCFTKKKEKVAIVGCIEIAGTLYALQQIYGDKILTYCDNPNRFYSHLKYDIEISQNRFIKYLKKPFVFGKLLKNAKSFIYLGANSFTYFKEAEFKKISKRKIPIIFIFLGSEIRSPELFKKQASELKLNTYYDYILNNTDIMEINAKKNALLADKYGSLIFSQKRDQISYLKSEQYFFPPFFDSKKICNCMNKFENFDRIRVLHAPSNPNVKGTPVVRAAIMTLKSKGYDFDYIELTGVDNSIVIEELKKSHIVLNQFYLLTPGIFGLEAMASCNAVLMSAIPSEFPYEFNDAWLETHDYEIVDNLKYLLDNKDEIKRYAINGYNYIKENFDRYKIKEYMDKYLSKYI